MTKINDGGAAFPLNTGNNHEPGAFEPEPGMSMRDYVAAHAPITLDDAIDLCGLSRSHHPMRNDTDRAVILEVMVMVRFEYADAFLAARNGGQDDE